MAGNRERPKTSTGTRPLYAERSSSTACAERARLCTHSITSSSYLRMWAKMRGFDGASGS